MKSLVLAAAIGMIAAAPAEASTFSVKTLSDAKVGTAKRELLAQKQHSLDVIEFFTEGPHRWMPWPKRSHCWTLKGKRVRRVCDLARRQLTAHRWLLDVANTRYRERYAPKPKPRVVAYTGGICWSCWARVAGCESGGNPSTNTGNGFYGAYQFDYGTWMAAGGGLYASRADLASYEQQTVIAEALRKQRGLGPWPVCGGNYYG